MLCWTEGMARRPKISVGLEQNGAGDHLITGDFFGAENGGIQ
jgi:hypothetical protein